MRTFSNVFIIGLSASALFTAHGALAQTGTANADGTAKTEGNTKIEATTQTTLGAGTDPDKLPPPQSSDDPKPPPPSPVVATTGVTEQAGIGGTQAYGRAGVLELGGFANLTLAKDFTSAGLNPTFGYFFVDNVEISAIIGVDYISQTTTLPTGESQKASATQVRLLAEPSFHLPFTPSLYGFLGVGFGLASSSVSPGTGAGAGFAVAPRLGVNVMVGRSGIFSPALQGIYQTTEAVSTPQGAVVAVKSSFGLQAGYTVMW